MGINERKEREREGVRELILNAAREIFVSEGYENTSMRKIAQKIEYSPGTIYHHFKDKGELLLALHDKAFECKINALFVAVQHIPDPMDRLIATGRAYVQYGLDNPQDYELMFILDCAMQALALREEFWKDGATAIDMLKQTITQCQRAGYIRPDRDPDSLSLMLWAQVHGLVTLYNTERLNIYPAADKQGFLFKAYEDYMAFFRKSMA